MRLATTLFALLLAAYTTTPRQTWREPSCFQKRKLLAAGRSSPSQETNLNRPSERRLTRDRRRRPRTRQYIPGSEAVKSTSDFQTMLTMMKTAAVAMTRVEEPPHSRAYILLESRARTIEQMRLINAAVPVRGDGEVLSRKSRGRCASWTSA